jgi:hypothetical protein
MKQDVVVFTCDKHLWAVQPFAWLFNKYWGTDDTVIIVGFNEPKFALPRNFYFYSVSVDEYPATKWVDAAIKFLDEYSEKRFILMHEDYWMVRPPDKEAIYMLDDYMNRDENILRIDLTTDRLYAGGMRDVDYLGRIDIIEAPGSPYQMSHQACLMDREKYLSVIKSLDENHRSAWEVELEGTTIVNKHGSKMRVLGTRQSPIRYSNGLLKGKLDWNEIPKLKDEDFKAISVWLPEELKNNNV